MDINALLHLKYIFAAAEYGSMRRVAHAFGVHESSVSRNILLLEQYLNLQLFERDNNGVHLTKAGRAWLNEIRVHYEKLEEALARTALGNKNLTTLRVGVDLSVGQGFLPKLIGRFEKAHPCVAIAVEEIVYRKYAHAIRRRALDVAFISGNCRPKSCRSEVVWEEGFAVLLPAGHALCNKQAVHWADLAGEKLLIPERENVAPFDPRFWPQIKTLMGRLAVRHCDVSQSIVFIDVQLGKGITLASESLAKIMRIDRAVWRPIAGPSSSNPVSAIWLESNPKRAVFRLVAMAKHMAVEGYVNTVSFT
ncbi:MULTISPECIES: LysR family transcriptional regulator [unclassified Rhizobium]|uniref:LysR family transcriptional regulator n=1 Tax=unclassified Rhizobium TaxID=2613769 RepID=UPI0037F51901